MAWVVAAATLAAVRAAEPGPPMPVPPPAETGESREPSIETAQSRGAPVEARESRELDAARTAWRYFERNTDPLTGLVRSVEGYPSTTAWDQGSSILAMVAARELGLIGTRELEERAGALLRTLQVQPLFAGVLPNKAYDTATARMTDYKNVPAPGGIGWSALDLGRLASALVLLGELEPGLRRGVERVFARWDLCQAVRGGELVGAQRDGGVTRETQEGRLGYEQYAAQALALLGQDASTARRYDRFGAEVAILGVSVPRDRRDRRTYRALDAVVTEPWVVDAFEFGLDAQAAPLARRVFDVQKRRWEATGTVTALSEDHVDRPPWFVYDAIWVDGHAWRTVSSEGDAVEGLRGVSTKAALSLATLYPDDPYAQVLRRAVERARDPERGWFGGVYEDGTVNRSLNANTNGVVLEAALFAARGPLHVAAEAAPGAVRWRAALARLGREGRSCLVPAALVGTPVGGGSGGGIPAAGIAGLERPAPRARGPLAVGELFTDYRGTDRGGTGGMATVYPWRYWFVRGGGEWTPWSPVGRSRFLWGFGYDDWHDGTFSVTVHNWGPVRPEDGPGVNQAELNVGYKVPQLCGAGLCLASYPFVDVPFDGGPYVGARLTLTLHERWFGMVGAGWVVPGVLPAALGAPRYHLFWGVGRRDWRPGSIFITYHDWGPTPQDRNGILAVGVNWRF